MWSAHALIWHERPSHIYGAFVYLHQTMTPLFFSGLDARSLPQSACMLEMFAFLRLSYIFCVRLKEGEEEMDISPNMQLWCRPHAGPRCWYEKGLTLLSLFLGEQRGDSIKD